MWKQDPVMAPFQTAPQAAEAADGLRRPARQEGRRGLEQVHRHRDVRQACSGKMKPEEAVKWAAGELGKIYTGA